MRSFWYIPKGRSHDPYSCGPAAVDYLLLTPGPSRPPRRCAPPCCKTAAPGMRTTTRVWWSPSAASWCASPPAEYESDYSAVLLLRGSYVVESVLGSAIGVDECLLIINNGLRRPHGEMARCLCLRHHELDCGETTRPEPAAIEAMLARHPDHPSGHGALRDHHRHAQPAGGGGCPLPAPRHPPDRRCHEQLWRYPYRYGPPWHRVSHQLRQQVHSGVPGFGFVIARRAALAACAGRARSVSPRPARPVADHGQQGASGALPRPPIPCSPLPRPCASWTKRGHCRPPSALPRKSAHLGCGHGRPRLCTAAARTMAIPIITAFYSPAHPDYRFADFYQRLKAQSFVIYPGRSPKPTAFASAISVT